MNDTIAVALISGGASIMVGVLTLIGVLCSNRRSNRDIQSKLELAQGITDTKIEELTREVRAHNNFAQRVPVLEEQVRVVNHRIKDLEEYHK